MMEWYQIVSFFLTNEIRIILVFYFVSKLLKIFPDKKPFIIIAFGGAIISSLQVVALPMAVVFVTEVVILVAAEWYYLRNPLRLCIYLSFFFEIGVGLWDFLTTSGLGVLFHSYNFVDTKAIEYLLCIWLVRFLMICIAILLSKHWYNVIMGRRIITIVVVLGILGSVSLSEQTILQLDEDQVGSWIILSMVLMLAILFYRTNRQHEMELEIAKLKQDRAEIVERDYETLSRTYADNAKLYHDLHNHIDAIYQCLIQNEIQEAIGYCEELRTPVLKVSQTVWTGDKAVDYLINRKMELAEQAQIKTKVNIEYPINTNIRSVDLVTILGNLLDNALEAAEIASTQFRFIYLTIRRINDMLIIKVENGYTKEPIVKEGEMLTSKTDKISHGWGIKSIQTTAERYDGTINTENSDSIFRSVVTLSFQAIKTEQNQ